MTPQSDDPHPSLPIVSFPEKQTQSGCCHSGCGCPHKDTNTGGEKRGHPHVHSNGQFHTIEDGDSAKSTGDVHGGNPHSHAGVNRTGIKPSVTKRAYLLIVPEVINYLDGFTNLNAEILKLFYGSKNNIPMPFRITVLVLAFLVGLLDAMIHSSAASKQYSGDAWRPFPTCMEPFMKRVCPVACSIELVSLPFAVANLFLKIYSKSNESVDTELNTTGYIVTWALTAMAIVINILAMTPLQSFASFAVSKSESSVIGNSPTYRTSLLSSAAHSSDSEPEKKSCISKETQTNLRSLFDWLNNSTCLVNLFYSLSEDGGLDLSDSTLCFWFSIAGSLLISLPKARQQTGIYTRYLNGPDNHHSTGGDGESDEHPRTHVSSLNRGNHVLPHNCSESSMLGIATAVDIIILAAAPYTCRALLSESGYGFSQTISSSMMIGMFIVTALCVLPSAGVLYHFNKTPEHCCDDPDCHAHNGVGLSLSSDDAS